MPRELDLLVERFEDHRAEYLNPLYSEAQVRIDFLNPMFSLLGWDVPNTAGLGSRGREVVTEPRQRRADGAIEFPDYLFRLNARPVFAVEAKKPAVNLRDDPLPALQLRRYGWNSKNLGVGILTDFHEFSVYDCRIPPKSGDKASKARIAYFTFDQYPAAWDEIAGLFSKAAVLDGALDEYIASLTGTRGSQRVDRVFLKEIEVWRSELAVALALKNDLDAADLNEAVQLTIDRIIFLRICEDRGIEAYGDLRSIATGQNIYKRLVARFRRADEKFNSGLFHFSKERGRSRHDSLTPDLIIPDAILQNFINRLYWPEGPYSFAVFPPDVLGQVYEQFLGKVIKLEGTSQAIVEDKPEVRKAGGVFYTPTHVVRHIIQNTLGVRLLAESVDTIARNGLRICDPSCGSGSFLIEVYQLLLDWHLEQYLQNPTKWSKSRTNRIRKDPGDVWMLTADERKRILLAHVFGVDIDPQAVEVTKLALLLKVLEGETEASLHEQTELFHARVLPDLDANIKCGNSLVGNAFHFEGQSEFAMNSELEIRVNAFDWPAEFPVVAGGRGFDVLVGNPPWLMAGYYVADVVPYLKSHFSTATGKFDLYYVFLEQALRLLCPGGDLGMIVPNKFFHTRAGGNLRKLLAERCAVRSLEDFGLAKVFEGATNYSCVILAQRGSPLDHVAYSEVDVDLETLEAFDVDHSTLNAKTWVFQNADARDVFEQMRAGSTTLESLVARFGSGVQSGADTILSLPRSRFVELGLEPELGRKVLRGRDVRAFQLADEPRVLIFPYSDDGDEYRLLTEAEIGSFPNTWAYLKRNRKKLANRVWFDKSAEELSGAWYGLMYVETKHSVTSPHLLSPCLIRGSNFALGDESLWATGTAGVTGVVVDPTSGWPIESLLGLLNSAPVSCFAAKHSPIYQGGYRKFSAPYLKEVPIPTIPNIGSNDEVKALGRFATDMTTLADRIVSSQGTRDEDRFRRQQAALQQSIDQLAYDLFGFNPAQREWVRQHVAR